MMPDDILDALFGPMSPARESPARGASNVHLDEPVACALGGNNGGSAATGGNSDRVSRQLAPVPTPSAHPALVAQQRRAIRDAIVIADSDEELEPKDVDRWARGESSLRPVHLAFVKPEVYKGHAARLADT